MIPHFVLALLGNFPRENDAKSNHQVMGKDQEGEGVSQKRAKNVTKTQI